MMRTPKWHWLTGAALVAATAVSAASSSTAASPYDDAVEAVLALPYNPAAVPAGIDTAFAADDYPAAFPLTDLAGGACCAGPVPDQPPLADLAPPFAEFPAGFDLIELASIDGTPLHAFAALRPGAPGIVVMHGFNTNGKYSIVRYAAFLYANGYSVIAPDHRDMGREWARGGSWHPDGTRHGQSLGWKEAEDLLTAARWLDGQGTDQIGVLGFSEGAQNTILALGIDDRSLIDAALTFSPPADQRSLVQRSPQTTSALLTTVVGNGDVCDYLTGVGSRPEFSATPNFMLRQDSAVDTLDGLIGSGVRAPALHFYTNDDTLVPPWNATALASRTNTIAEQHTVLLPTGNHAYFADRWWTQQAALTWFGAWLDPTGAHTTRAATVTRTPGGTPAGSQQIDLGGVSHADGDAELVRTDVCAPADAVGPTAVLDAYGSGSRFALDGRRSYSGWDDHSLASWSIDPGDGTPATSGTDIRDALVDHRFVAAGSYTVTLVVTDDSGRSASTTAVVEADPDEDPPPTGGVARGAGELDDDIEFAFDTTRDVRPVDDDEHDDDEHDDDGEHDDDDEDDGTGSRPARLHLVDENAGVAVRIDVITAIGALTRPCGSVPRGGNSLEFFGSGEIDGVAATFRVCVSDERVGDHDDVKKSAPADRFVLECVSSCSYRTSDHARSDRLDEGDLVIAAPPAG